MKKALEEREKEVRLLKKKVDELSEYQDKVKSVINNAEYVDYEEDN